MNIAELRSMVRRDLRDETPAEQRWSDDEIDRHIQHAVRDLSRAAPQEAVAMTTLAAGSREVSLGSLRDLLDVEAVEHPVDRHPASFVPFSRWAGSLLLQVDEAPSRGEQARVYYTRLHTVDATSSTLPAGAEDTVALGASAYAALAWASYAANRVNLGGEETARHYRAWGNGRLEAFQRALGKLAARRGVRTRRMYRAAQPLPPHLRVRGA